MSSARRNDRYAGALLGVHAGDSLGATVEFQPWAAIRSRYPDGVREIVGGGPFRWQAGHATDDTDLTRAVLLAYLDPAAQTGADVVQLAAQRMLDWLHGNWPDREPGSRPVDIGGATRVGLERYERTGDWRKAGAGDRQAGNGSLMRCIPTALAVVDRERRIRESVGISAITHDDPRCTIACAAYNEIVAALLNGARAAAAVEVGRATACELAQAEVDDAIAAGTRLNLAEIAKTGNTQLAYDAAGYVLESLSLGVAAVLDPRPLNAILIDVVRIGNDTDTNAAIAGGLLGARDGASAIPDQWRATLQFGEEFTSAAAVLLRMTVTASAQT